MKHYNTQFLAFWAVLAGSVVAQDRPIALVEHINAAPDAAIQAFDYVYEGDKIDLRPGGELRLAYFDKCEVENFTGGLIKLKDDGPKISKGGASVKNQRACQTAALAIAAHAREAGVSVKRVTPFAEGEWLEISVATSTPRFIWARDEDQNDEAAISVYFLDVEPANLIWQGASLANHFTYPADAPVLTPGMPYEVIVSYDGKEQTRAVFSVDPNLDLADNLLTTAVPLGL